jgi:hypothetical protein
MNRLLSPLILVVSAALTFRAAGASEELPPLELPVPPEILRKCSNDFWGVYVLGMKAGWSRSSQGRGTHGGKDVIECVMEMTLMLGGKSETRSREVFDAAPPYRVLLLEDAEKSDGQERRAILRLKEGTTYAVEVTEAGKTRTLDDATFDYRLAHTTSAGAWCADPARKPGDAIGTLKFDFARMAMEPENSTILKEAEWIGPDGKLLPVWEVEDYNLSDGSTAIGRFSRADGSLVAFSVGHFFESRLEQEALAKQMPARSPDVHLSLTIKSDCKLGSAAALTALELELTAAEGHKAPSLTETVNQKIVRRSGDRSITIRITRGMGTPQPATGEERAAYLKSTRRYPAGEREIRDLAAQAVGQAAADVQKVKNLLRFTDNYLRDSNEVEALTVMDLLESRQGECSAHALLFTTLARAAGIPAREVGGWIYMGDSSQSFGGHAWNEVILDGHWVPVDSTRRQLQLDAGHIQSFGLENKARLLEDFSPGLRARVISSRRE